MLKIQDAVREILYRDEEALYALSHDYMNLSAYAKQIASAVGQISQKDVDAASIVVSLSRIKKI